MSDDELTDEEEEKIQFLTQKWGIPRDEARRLLEDDDG